MGLVIYPLWRTPLDSVRTQTTGEFLAREFETLDEIAYDFGLTPLTAFCAQREVPDDFDGDPSELDEVLGPCQDWFCANEGSEALRDLAKLISERPEASGRLECPDAIVLELKDLARQLKVAAKAGTEFRLEMSS